MRTMVFDSAGAVRQAAEQVRLVLASKPEAVLALAAGRAMERLYAELARMANAGQLPLAKARVFSVTEFENVRSEQSCRRMLEKRLLQRTELRPENCFFLSPETLEDYDEAIAKAGGLDMAVLGLGDNAHIGFNEPATPFASQSHRQKLTDATRRQLAEDFGGFENTPEFGLTMGIQTLVSAREILLLALGAEKTQAVHRMVYGRTDSAVPAAFLQLPREVTVYLDREAAEML